jgi:hypothetical protein
VVLKELFSIFRTRLTNIRFTMTFWKKVVTFCSIKIYKTINLREREKKAESCIPNLKVFTYIFQIILVFSILHKPSVFMFHYGRHKPNVAKLIVCPHISSTKLLNELRRNLKMLAVRVRLTEKLLSQLINKLFSLTLINESVIN